MPSTESLVMKTHAASLLLVQVAAVLAALVSPLQAEMIVQTQGFVAKPGLEKTLVFNQFDPASGQLQAVRVDLLLEISGGTLSVDNDGPMPVTTSVELGVAGQLRSDHIRLVDEASNPIFGAANPLVAKTGSSLELASDNGDLNSFDPTGPDGQTYTGGDLLVIDGSVVKPEFLMDFFGTDVFTMVADLDPFVDFGTGDQLSGQSDPVTVYANVILTYDLILANESVPEPSSLILLALGGMGIWHRRRRAS
jgi:hypothetical protein